MKSLRYLYSVIKYCSFENESERGFCTFLFLLRRGGGVFKIVNKIVTPHVKDKKWMDLRIEREWRAFEKMFRTFKNKKL